jgi:4-hydroxy-4-methyl-2-oxoglutarate aldolase
MSNTRALIEQLREFESALITEAMGAMGCPDPESFYLGREIRLLTQTNEPLAGLAVTITCDTSTPGLKPSNAGLWECLEQLKAASAPGVVIMKAVGSRPLYEAVLGDGMAKLMKSSGAVGVVTDGGVRDLAHIEKLGFTLFGAGTVSNHTPPVVKLATEPVVVSGVTFRNGDVVFGDRDGVILVPEPYHAGLIEACIYTRDFETRVHTFWRRSDKSLQEKKDHVAREWATHQARCRPLMRPGAG